MASLKSIPASFHTALLRLLDDGQSPVHRSKTELGIPSADEPGETLIAGIRSRLRALREAMARRPDTEHEQAIIRVVIVALATIYILVLYGREIGSPTILFTRVSSPFLSIAVLVFSIILLIDVIKRPGPAPFRRLIGMAADIGGTCYVIGTEGEVATPLYVILLWVTFGNGFRYGRRYLAVSTAFSIVGFLLAVSLNPWWAGHGVLAAGLLGGIILLPAYIASLLRLLQAAIVRVREANSAKSRFLANMSHEMRTPLNGIMSFADFLAETQLSAEQDDHVRTIRSSAELLLSLVNDVLDISKIEAGRLTLETIDFDLHALVRTTVDIVTPQALMKGLALHASVPSDIPYLLKGDSVQIRKIILNLLSNAVKFTEKGKVLLRLTMDKETDESVTLRFEVVDTGIGIPLDAQARVFDSFVQADESITRRFGGTGLGTTISKQLVEMMGGEIGLVSEPGMGSKFWFTLTLPKVQRQEVHHEEPSSLACRRILLLSADVAVEESVIGHLSSWGAVAVAVGAVDRALVQLNHAADGGAAFDTAIIVAAGLGTDPAKVARDIRALPGGERIRLILVDRRIAPSRVHSHVECGYDAAIRAPVEKPFLFNALHFVKAEEGERRARGVAELYRSQTMRARPARILVAEDTFVNQKVMANILGKAGHSFKIVSDGGQALDALGEETFDIAFIDLHMPVHGGLEIARTTRFAEGGGRRLPMVALTADATIESRETCLEAGFDEFVSKPFRAVRILEMIDRFVESDGVASDASTSTVHYSSALEAEPAAGRVHAVQPSPFTVDLRVLRDLAGPGAKGDFLERMIRAFVTSSVRSIGEMDEALRAGAWETVRERAHALKGNAGQVGAIGLMQECASLEALPPLMVGLRGGDCLRRIREAHERAAEALMGHVSSEDLKVKAASGGAA